MKTVLLGDPPPMISSLIAERQRLGQDTHDEVWHGEYHMAPAASYEHGKSEMDLGSLFRPIAHARGMQVGAAFNLGQIGNFRVPDMGVHRGQPSGVWLDTAAIVVEVRSPDDETYDKFEFYFEHGVEELLITDLVSHEVQWYRRGESEFVRADSSDVLGLSAEDVRRQLRW
jgi:Uma2 family endonuclease